MAATGRREILLSVLVVARLCAQAPEASDTELLKPVNHIASALSDNNAGDALAPIQKSFAGYGTLQQYFFGLADGFLISNEVDLTNKQQDPTGSASIDVQWTITLTSQDTHESSRRRAPLHLKLVRKGRKWMIAEISPVSFFDPQAKQ
jgi:hypothetical protein